MTHESLSVLSYWLHFRDDHWKAPFVSSGNSLDHRIPGPFCLDLKKKHLHHHHQSQSMTICLTLVTSKALTYPSSSSGKGCSPDGRLRHWCGLGAEALTWSDIGIGTGSLAIDVGARQRKEGSHTHDRSVGPQEGTGNVPSGPGNREDGKGSSLLQLGCILLCWPPRPVRTCCWRATSERRSWVWWLQKDQVLPGTPPVIAVSWNSPARPADPMAEGHTHFQSIWYHDVTKRVLSFYFFPQVWRPGWPGAYCVYKARLSLVAILLPPRCWGYRSMPPHSVGRGSLWLCFPLMGSDVREAGTAVPLNRGCGEITTELFKSFLLISGKEILI